MMRRRPKRWLTVRPLLLVVLTMMLIGSGHTAEAQTASEQTVEARKSPGLALGLSFLIPGAGQAYNGQWAKGGLMLGGYVVSAWVVLPMSNIGDCLDNDDSQAGAACRRTAALIGVVGFWVWSMIDAPRTAKSINRRIDAGQVALEFGPQLILPQSRSAMGGLRPSGFPSFHRDSGIDLSFVRVRF